MRKLHGLLTGFLLFCWVAVSAQTREVSGNVTDSRDGTPLPKVTVKVKGASVTALTEPDGSFRINVPASATTLVFSYVGFDDLEQAISNQMNVSLIPGEKSLSEVVVVGYGTKSKRDVTGSVAKVSSKELANTPVTSFESAIQGRAAGVFVEQQNGKLGQAIKIRVRGSSSVTAGNEPLYVVDGIPVITTDLSGNGAATNPLSDLNMNDIESIEILKDASSAAIYGSRGSNGVVLITTKRGKAGKSKVELGFFTGDQQPTRKMDFMNAEQYVKYMFQAARGRGEYRFNNGNPDGFSDLQEALEAFNPTIEGRMTRYSAGNDDWKTYKVNTDWQDEVFQYAPITQLDLGISGGNDKTTFYMGGQLLDQKGILVRNSFRRYNGRINLDHKVNNWLSIGANLSFARTQNGRITNDNGFATPLQIVALSPITPVIDPRSGKPSGAYDPANGGSPNSNYPLYYNPLLSVDGASYTTLVNRSLGNLYGQLQLAKGLTFRTEFGLDQLNQSEDAYYGPVTVRNNQYPRGGGFTSNDQILNVTTNNFFRYVSQFNDQHDLDITGGMSFQEQRTLTNSGTAESMPSEAYRKLTAASTISGATSAETRFSFLSYFARASYKLKDKYLLAVSGRMDASSRFGEDNRWGFFPAVSAGWILSEENFLKSSATISFLKLKASYGITGNAEIGNFGPLGLYGAVAYGGIPGQHPTQLANPDLKWETTASADIGIEIAFFNNRLSAEVDVYTRKTTDLLLNMEVPGTSGFSAQLRNIGKLENKGIEFSINSDNIVARDFRWTTNINFGLNRNKITDLQGTELGLGNENRAREGEALGVFVAREFAGADPANGDALFVLNTRKADGTLDRGTTNNYNQAQEVVIGNPNPDFIYGMRNTFTYKSLDLEVFLQGVYGNDIYKAGGVYMSASGSNGYDNQTVDQLAAWQKPGDITMVPQARLGMGNGIDPSSRYISEGSYLRVKAVTLGVNLPPVVLKKLHLDRARFYVRGQNLFTITNYTGWDPEVNADFMASNINQGNDFYSAPQVRAIIFGINVGL
ncbi:MAG: TonB-dependent receptor [Candidatus Pseudobacter hemicellulosilyticus]|uniref:TonB-dependent receptor n=1 Tax=Candidatus Pseudobacter hemicellulosilyticus TaxID=3121375 RepID=A0AAJ5WXC9_9BACT|nr:MAG: TonB-dependent receptor [Pseudobacter sp.]